VKKVIRYSFYLF